MLNVKIVEMMKLTYIFAHLYKYIYKLIKIGFIKNMNLYFSYYIELEFSVFTWYFEFRN